VLSAIDDWTFMVLKDDDSTQVVNHYILSGQMVRAADYVVMQ